MGRFSVIILVYKRYTEIKTLIDYYTNASDDVIVVDNGGELNKYVPITNDFLWIRMSKNTGSTAKFKAVSFSKHPYVLITDDDIVPIGELLPDLFKTAFEIQKWDILTVFGINFEEGDYYKNLPVVALDIEKPQKVDFAGQFYFGRRELFLVDLKNTHSYVDDVMLMYLQDKQFGKLNRYVFPTKNYRHAKDINIPQALSRQDGFEKSRRVLTKAIYENNKELINKMLEGYHFEKNA